MVKSYSAQIRDLANLRNGQIRDIAAQSIQDVVEAAQTPQLGITRGATDFEVGKIPVAEADLINSLVSRGSAGGEGDGYAAVIAGMQIGDQLTFAWTAEHARPMEYGFEAEKADGTKVQVPGRHFVGANAARFEDFVEARAKEILGK